MQHKYRGRAPLAAALLALSVAAAACAETAATNAPPVVTNAVSGTLVLSLAHCLELALGGNLTLAIGRVQPEIRGQDYFIAGETFTPTFSANAQVDDHQSPSDNSQVGASVLDQKTTTGDVTLSKTWTLGTRADLAWASARSKDNSEFRLLNPSYEARPQLQVTQPLLRGFGFAVNRADLDRALVDKAIADSDFAILLESELLATYRAYWDLVRTAAGSDLEHDSLRLAADQVAIVSNRLDVGAAAPLDLTSAEAALAREQELVITADNDYRKAADALLYHIRPSSRADDYDLAIIPSTEPTPTEAMRTAPDLESSIQMALAERPELHKSVQSIQRAAIDVAATRNERLPDLSAFGKYGYDGVAGQYQDAVDQVRHRTYPQWTAGLSLSFLFDNESRRAHWRQAVLGKESAELSEQQAVAEVVVEVRSARFDLQTAIQQLDATKRTAELARAQYEGELDRLRVGGSTVFQVDTFRRDQVAAERDYLNARIDLFVAQAVLAVARGEFAKQILASAQPAAKP